MGELPSEVWRDFTDLTSPLSNDHALALMHTWRYQGPLHDFFLQETSKAARSFGSPAIVVLGTGNMAAARACLEVLHSNDACQATLLEPSEGLAYLAREVLQPEKRKMRVLHLSSKRVDLLTFRFSLGLFLVDVPKGSLLVVPSHPLSFSGFKFV